jgi:hypothetical protein
MYRGPVTNEGFFLRHGVAQTDHACVPATSADADEPWYLTIGSIVVGLLALSFFLWMGGVLALVGPCVIFAVRVVITRQAQKRKALLDLHGIYETMPQTLARTQIPNLSSVPSRKGMRGIPLPEVALLERIMVDFN